MWIHRHFNAHDIVGIERDTIGRIYAIWYVWRTGQTVYGWCFPVPVIFAFFLPGFRVLSFCLIAFSYSASRFFFSQSHRYGNSRLST